MKKRFIFDKKATFKKVVRTGALAVLAAVLCAYCSESGVLTASAASRSVTAVRKYYIGNVETKAYKEVKSLSTVKTGKTTIKVTSIGEKTKKNDGLAIDYRNGLSGDSHYKYFSYVKYKIPKTGIYYFTFNNLKSTDKNAVYSMVPTISRVKYEDHEAILTPLRLYGERNDFTEDFNKYSYEDYNGANPREVLTQNYKSVVSDYLNNEWKDFFYKESPDASTADYKKYRAWHKDDLYDSLCGFYYVNTQENGVVGGEDRFKNGAVGKYHTIEKLKKGEIILIGFTNACKLNWKATEEGDATRSLSKDSYTIDLEIKKK